MVKNNFKKEIKIKCLEEDTTAGHCHEEFILTNLILAYQ